MSSSYDFNYHDHSFCPSCGKKKPNHSKPLGENYHFEEDMSPSKDKDKHKDNHDSIKHLLLILIKLLKNLQSEKDSNQHGNCKFKKDHEKHTYGWWKHDESDEDDMHYEHSHKHDCKCKHNKEEHHNWWDHDKKQDKKNCKCHEKYMETKRNYHHTELKPAFTLPMKDDSSSYEYEYIDKEKKKNHCDCPCYKYKKYHYELESSSSEEMQKPKYEKDHKEMPDKIWLADILSLLYKYDLLNLDKLFEQMDNAKPHHDQPKCKCQKEKNAEEYDHYEYTKEYYFKGMPLKKIKRKADTFKKDQ